MFNIMKWFFKVGVENCKEIHNLKHPKLECRPKLFSDETNPDCYKEIYEQDKDVESHIYYEGGDGIRKPPN